MAKNKATAISGALGEEQLAHHASPPLTPEAPPTREEVRAMVRDAVLEATVPLLQRLRALEEELRGRGGAPMRSKAPPKPRNPLVDGVSMVARPPAPAVLPAPVVLPAPAVLPVPAVLRATSFDIDLADDGELAKAFNGGRRRKQIAWVLGLIALLAVASAVIGAIASNMR